MGTIHLDHTAQYSPVLQMSPQERFELACHIAQALPGVQVQACIGDDPEDVIVLDAGVLGQQGARLF